jgi:Na+-translocating ferredoxin:NAD+ oxidoreductase RNF subunit RnfB
MNHLKNRSLSKTLRHAFSIPFIYGVGLLLIPMHLFIEIYHSVTFRLYGIKLVNRKKYIKIDRYKLSKLTLLQKFNCVYCGYANGLLAYATAIGVGTEKYWCGIKHGTDKTSEYIEPAHHKNFAKYEEYK